MDGVVCVMCTGAQVPNGAQTACRPNLGRKNCITVFPLFFTKAMKLELIFETDGSNSPIFFSDCKPNEITSSDACIDCGAGEIPNTDKNGCEKCPSDKITMNGVVCVECTGAKVPNGAQTACRDKLGRKNCITVFPLCLPRLCDLN